MQLRHFYPDLSQLDAGYRAIVEANPHVEYLPWLNQLTATQGDKWAGPWNVHPNIEQHLIGRRFIDEDGKPLTDMGYLDVEGPSTFWHGERIGFTEERARIYQQLRARVYEIIPPQMKLGFFSLTDTPAHWRGAFPADRMAVIHRMSSAIFVSAYFHEGNERDPDKRFEIDKANAMQAVRWHSSSRANIDVPVVAFVWAKWKDPAYQVRQYMPIEKWRRWLRELSRSGMCDALCYFGSTVVMESPYFEAFAELK